MRDEDDYIFSEVTQNSSRGEETAVPGILTDIANPKPRIKNTDSRHEAAYVVH